MLTTSNQRGFSLTELLVSTTVTLAMMGAAITTVKNAMTINDTGSQLSDANHNLRSGANLLVGDLMETGRGVPVGGVPIPSGAGAQPINRPAPPNQGPYFFDNVNATTLPAITTGNQLGPTITGGTTDMITLLMMDMQLPSATIAVGSMAGDSTSMTLVPGNKCWITGAPADCNGKTVPPLKKGDLVFFTDTNGNALRSVTNVDDTKAYFLPSSPDDWFNFNQDAAAQGTLGALQIGGAFPALTVQRLTMLTYYVDAVTTPGTPRLTRVQDDFGPQALAGIVEDLDITYDLVDGGTNPVAVPSLPVMLGNPAMLYSSNQIRKVNLHVGVRSDTLSTVRGDYIRNHLTTSVSVRDLASVTRYF